MANKLLFKHAPEKPAWDIEFSNLNLYNYKAGIAGETLFQSNSWISS